MADTVFKEIKSGNIKPKPLVKKGALSVINGDINTRKRSNKTWKQNCKQNCKSQKQEISENNPNTLNRQKNPACVKENENFVKNHLLQKQEESKNKYHVLGAQTNSLIKEDEFATVENCLTSISNCLSINETPENLLTEKSAFSQECNETVKKGSKSNKKKNERQKLDSVWCTPYRDDIYAYFKDIEKNFRPNPNYMDKQTDITMNMRSVLVDWFFEVGEEYKLHAETLHLAVSYVDRFLSHMSVLRGKLQLVGTASMFLASKYEEIYPPEISDFVYITNDTYTKKQVLRMEHLILKVLNFDVSVPTAYAFLQLYCSMCNASETVANLSQYICELSLLDGNPFLKFIPSAIAAGSLALANYILGLNMWDDEMAAASKYQLADLMYVILCLFNKYSSMPSCPHQAVYDKYKSQKYNAVANIPQPETLTFPENSSKRLCYI